MNQQEPVTCFSSIVSSRIANYFYIPASEFNLEENYVFKSNDSAELDYIEFLNDCFWLTK